MADDLLVLDDLPDDVQATIEARDRAFAALGAGSSGLEAVVDRLRRWLPGRTVRVAFLGGSKGLHEDIAETGAKIAAVCNLTLDFGRNEKTGKYRTWSVDDEGYSAEIRVSFDQNGYFSLVGTDSVGENIGRPEGPVGGRPGQRSLNLGGFHIQRPATWHGTVLHEFLHALGFHHEHANFRGPCQQAFRWEDEEGYVPTTSARGVFVPDSAGKRPGIYTYLGGAPNFWSRGKVDHNLREARGEGIEATEFDPASVMLYRFPSLFYRTPDSACSPASDGQTLSDGDRAGLAHLYPGGDSEVAAAIKDKETLLSGMEASPSSGLEGLESAGARPNPLESSIACLRRQLAAAK